MKMHDVNYHDHNDSISFYFDHCNHFETSEHSYSNQKTKKEVSFRKKKLSSSIKNENRVNREQKNKDLSRKE